MESESSTTAFLRRDIFRIVRRKATDAKKIQIDKLAACFVATNPGGP